MVKKETKEPEKDRLIVTKDKAKAKLQKQIDEGEEIAKLPVNNDQAIKQALDKSWAWLDFTEEVLLRVFSTNKMEQEFIWASRIIYSNPLDNFRKIDSYLNKLKSILNRVELYDDIVVPGSIVAIKADNKGVNTKKVFVIHGRNDALLKSMYGFLDAIGLEPIEWNRAISMTGKSTPSVSEIVSTAFQEAQAIVVLLTGDDVAKLRNEFVQDNDEAYERELTPQARPNVLFEAGMAMSAGDNRTVLVQVGKIRKFSDIQGLHITYLNNTPQKRQELVTKLRNAGCDIKDISAENRWMTTGDFEDKLDLSETHKESKKKSAAPVADDPLTRD